MKKKILSALFMSVAVSAAIPSWAVDYYDPSDRTVKASPNATTLTTQTLLSGGWYVVPAGTTTINDRIIVSNNVNLVLCDGATLNANSGISVTGGNSLTIWGQGGEHAVSGTSVKTRGTGALNAQTPGSGTYSQTAAIGGEASGTSTGDIVINGGVIVARGAWGAGIGRGNVAGGAVGSVTINEGHVTASGSKGSAGIGSGAYANSCPVTISGGCVVATGGVYDGSGQATPGIGTGRPRVNGSDPLSNGTITITGGTVIAQAGTAPSDGTAAQAIGVNVVDADHNGTSHLVLGAVRAYASAGATTPVAVSARGNTCRGAWVKLEACTSHGDANSDLFCDYCGGYCGPVPPTGPDGALVISTVSDWNAFASLVNVGGETCQSKTVRLAADVGTATTPVGTADHPFAGTFNGGGHTLTIAINGAGAYAAPFSRIDGATISNLVVTGTVSGGYHSAGLVGGCGVTGPNAVRDCTVSVAVSGAAYLGGVVGHGGSGTLALEGCVFSGAVNGFANFAGGLLGWCDALTLTITNCLSKGTFTPSGTGKYHPIACRYDQRTVSATVTDAYYLNTLVPTVPGVYPTHPTSNLIPGAEGVPVSTNLVAGLWDQPVTAPDGQTYYRWTPAPAGRLLARYSFDDAGNGGANLLHAAVGQDAIVRATPATPVAGIGNIAAVTDFSILSGLAPGDGAVAVTNGQYLAVPIPAALLSTTGLPYTVVMRIRVPGDVGWRCLLNMPTSNDSDAMVFVHKSSRTFAIKQYDKSDGGGTYSTSAVGTDRWTTLVLAFGENATDAYCDGAPILHTTGKLAGSYADCVASGGYILVGADDSYDDALFHLSEFRIYEGAASAAVNILPGSGTPADPYVISSSSDWDTFASNVLANADSAACYRLGADISVSTTVGTAEHPFRGTFDGANHTLTVNLGGADVCVAPFAHVAGATIRNLKVAGAVSGAMHCSGLVGGVESGVNTIENCEVAAAIATSGTHLGGFVGHGATYATTLRGCVFSGSLSGGTTAGTLWGWSDNGSSATLIDCLDTSASTHPIGRSEGTVSVSNTYYFASNKDYGNGDRLWSEDKRGKRAYAVTAGEGVEVDFGAPAATYGLTGIAAYGVGMAYDGVFYAGEGDAVSLTLSATPPPGKVLDGYSVSAGTLSQSGNVWSLTIPATDVIVSATWKWAWSGSGTAADPFEIGDAAGWNALADAVDRGLDTAGLHFVMTADIGPVTNMVGTADHPFGGVFNGTGHILELAIADTANMGTAPFRYIKDAVLANVKTTGTVNGSMHCAGLVGFAQGTNRIMQCEVAADVVCGGATHSHCGGILGHGLSSATTIRNCLFSGSISGATDATGVIYGWGDGGGTHAIENCLESGGYSMTLGLALLRTCGGEEVVQNCYRRNDGVSGGTDAGTLSDGELLAALGAGWGIRGGNVVPVVADEKDFMLATVRGLESVIYVNAESGGVRPAVTVADLRGATVDPSFYTVTIRDGDGAVVVGDLAFDSYTLTVQALEGNAGGYTGSRTIPFDTCPAGLSIDRDYARGETGRYYVNTSHVESEYEPVVVTLPEGFHTSFKVYDNGGKNDNYGVYGDDVLVLTAPEGCGLRISGTVAVRYDDCMSILDSDGRAFIDRMSTGESPVAIPVLTSCGRSLTICLFPYGAGPVEGFNFTVDIERRIDLASLTGDATIPDGVVVHGTLAGNYKISIADGATVTLRDLTIDGVDDPSCPWAGLTCLGDAAIILEGTNAVRGFHQDYPGISVPAGATLSVSGEGSLTVSRNGGGEGVAGDVALSGMAVATNGTAQVFTSKVVNLSSLRADRVLLDGEIATGVLMGDYQVSIADGATVTLRNATIDGVDDSRCRWAGLTCLGDAIIVLEGANAVKRYYSDYPGIFVPSGKTLAIRGGGTVIAQGGGDMSDYGGAGIGGAYGVQSGSVVIDGGTVTAYGGYGADGIGCGDGDVTINGGMVTAYGGSYGSGIGGCDNVVINGGTVVAEGGAECPGIGGGCDSVVIAGGTVTAVGGPDGAGIGAGTYVSCGSVTIGPDIVRITATCDDASDCQPIGDGYGGTCGTVTVAPGLRDTTTGLTRMIEPVQPALPGSGTEADPYLIESADHWRALGELVFYGAETAGKHYLLASNIVAATTVGTAERPFAGVFDGGGRTLIANLSGTGDYLAPFPAIADATISNLVVAGTVEGRVHCAGLVGYVAGGTNTVENCKVAAEITASDTHGGGLVGHAGDATMTLRGCVFSGDLDGASVAGTLCGWGDAAAVTLVDCLDESESLHPVGRGGSSVIVSNVYYYAADSKLTEGDRIWGDGARGKRAFSVTAGTGVVIDFGAPAAIYVTSGLTAYGPGLAYRGSGTPAASSIGTFYAGAEDIVCLSVSFAPPADTATDVYGLDAGESLLEPNGGGNGWTLEMRGDDDIIVAIRHELRDGAVLTGESAWRTVIAAGAAVTLSNAVLRSDSGIAPHRPGLECLGGATIVLKGTNVVESGSANCAGLRAGPTNTTLSISGTGALTAVGGECGAGIGGGLHDACGDIAISGGTVTAIGGFEGAGIGAGYNGSCGSIAISGGTVTATGGFDGAGIGGTFASSCGSIAISGGTVTATGGKYAAGIGTGDDSLCGSIAISGGTVKAIGGNGGAGIGGGWRGSCDGIEITDAVTRVVAFAGSESPNSVGSGDSGSCSSVIVGGVATGDIATSRFVYPQPVFGDLVDLADLRNDFEAGNGTVLTGTLLENYMITVAADATVTLSNAVIRGESDNELKWAGITCLGDATIVLAGTNVLRGFYKDYSGLQAGSAGTTLVIRGDGSLEADSNGRGCGIGGGFKINCGSIVIEGGTVVATGGGSAAGIGGGYEASCGDISIGSGVFRVVATHHGEWAAAPIGAGYCGTCGTVTVAVGLPDATEGNTRTITGSVVWNPTITVTRFHQSYPYSGRAALEYTIVGRPPASAVARIVLSAGDASASFVQSNIVLGVNTNAIDFASAFGGASLLTNASFTVTITADPGGVQLCSADGIVTYDPSPVTETTPVPVPYAWLDGYPGLLAEQSGDHEAAAGATAANGRPVWACYVVGADPSDPLDDFRITRFWMVGDMPMFEFNHTTDGSGNSILPYVRPLGKADLADRWRHVPDGGNPAFRFFAVEVVPPGCVSIVNEQLGGVQLWKNGPYWAECNIGAAAPEEYGYYFWWGDTVGYTRQGGTWTTNNGGYYYSTRWRSSTGELLDGSPFTSASCPTYGKDDATLQAEGWIDSTGNLAAAHDAATAHLGAPWRMPTGAEFAALVSNCTTTWTTTNGVYGRLVTGIGDYANRSIFLPAAGGAADGNLYAPGTEGYYWSSTPYSGDSYRCAWILDFYSKSIDDRYHDSRYFGDSIRPVRDPAK